MNRFIEEINNRIKLCLILTIISMFSIFVTLKFVIYVSLFIGCSLLIFEALILILALSSILIDVGTKKEIKKRFNNDYNNI